MLRQICESKLKLQVSGMSESRC